MMNPLSIISSLARALKAEVHVRALLSQKKAADTRIKKRALLPKMILIMMKKRGERKKNDDYDHSIEE